MTSNFGGKKAAPFRKGGKPRKAIVAKAVVAKAKRAKREMALSVITGREIDLGRDGSKWKHGWIPLNASAAALKAHKGKGAHVEAPGMDEHAKIIGRHVEAARKEAAASSTGDYTRQTPVHVGPKGQGFVRVTHSPKGSKYTTSTEVGGQRVHTEHNNGSVAALELHNRLYGVHKSMGSTSDGSLENFSLGKKATQADEDRFNANQIKRQGVGANTTGSTRIKVASGSSDLSPQAKIDNAEKMHGTGSKQHLAALQRFGTESQKRAAAYQIREKSSPNNVAGKYEAQLKGTATASLQHLYAMRGTVGAEHKDQIAKELKRRGARLPKRGSNDVGSKE